MTVSRRAPKDAPARPFPAGGRGSLGRRLSATAAEAATGSSASSVSAAGTGNGRSAARNCAPFPSKGMPVRSPRRCRKSISATSEPSVQESSVVSADTAISRPGPRPTADSPGRGRVPGSVRATARARYTVAASGTTHQARRSAAAPGVWGWSIA